MPGIHQLRRVHGDEDEEDSDDVEVAGRSDRGKDAELEGRQIAKRPATALATFCFGMEKKQIIVNNIPLLCAHKSNDSVMSCNQHATFSFLDSHNVLIIS